MNFDIILREKFNLLHGKSWNIESYLIDKEKYMYWCVCTPEDYQLYEYGWKIHISATVKNAFDIFDVVIPVLIQEKVSFKFTNNVHFLASLNSQSCALSQVGKFITIYPDKQEEVALLAEKLHKCTKNFTSPRILSDKPYTFGSIVHYRWGSFIARYKQTLYGEIIPIIKMNDGNLVYDKRLPFYSKPPFIENPFPQESEEESRENYILNNNFVFVKNISSSFRGEVNLAIDIESKKRCIIKTARKGYLIDNNGRDTNHSLEKEKTILEKLNNTGFTPKVYYFFQDDYGNSNLVMEDINGVPLDDYIYSLQLGQKETDELEIITLFTKLAKLIQSMHEKGIVHGDIKSNNILITDDKKLFIIDFENSYILGDKNTINLGRTIGFSRPIKKATKIKPPRIQDDIYSFGCILFYYVTKFTIPVLSHVNVPNIVKIFKLLSPNLSEKIKNITLKCFCYKKYNSLLDIINDLESNNPTDCLLESLNKKNFSSQRDFNFLRTAKKLLKVLLKEAEIEEFANRGSYNVPLYDLRGTAGLLLLFSKFFLKTRNDKLIDPIRLCCNILNNESKPYNNIPGFYVGESGTALALLEASKALNDPTIKKQAFNKLLSIKDDQSYSHDMYNGSAGRLKVALQFYLEDKNPKVASYIKRLVSAIIKAATIDNDQCYWTNPDLFSTVENVSFKENLNYIGYSHGAAGIIDSIIDYTTIFGDYHPEIIKIIQYGVNWIDKNIIYQNNNIEWPILPGKDEAFPYWCHGSVGIGVMYINLLKSNILPHKSKDLELKLEMILNRLTYISLRSMPIYCHGLAGNIDFLLEYYSLMKKTTVLEKLIPMFEMLDFWSDNVDLDFYKNVNGYKTTDYMLGLAGSIICYLKADDIGCVANFNLCE